MKSAFLVLIIGTCRVLASEDSVLQNVPGDELESHLPRSGRALVLFTRNSGCATCATVATELRAVVPELPLQASFSVEHAAVAATYADRVPAVVLFHGHTPMLYEGPMVADALAQFVSDNPQPRVVVLNDESFEHLTQASTGSTTGDWLVMFHGLDCARCVALESRLQGVAAKLRNSVLVAKVSSQTDGRETAKRFDVEPTQMKILFFRQGIMYSYESDKFDLTSLSALAVGLYKDAPSRPVPGPPQGPLMLILQVVGVLLVVGYVIMSLVSKRKQEQERKLF